MKTKIAIIGGGGHSKSILNLLKPLDKFEVLGYTDLEDKGLPFPYLGKDDVVFSLGTGVIIGVTYLKSPTDQVLRKKLIKKFEQTNCFFPTVFAKTAVIESPDKIKEGTVVFNSATINIDTVIGKHSILNTGSIIEHDCVLGENVFIGPGAVICGHTIIENNVFIGAGSIVRDSIRICENVVVGAGSNVTNEILEAGLYLGNPAKKITT